VSTQQITQAPATITHSLVRSWDYCGNRGLANRLAVCKVNPSAGVWDWGTFDQLLSNNAGKQVIMTLGCPADYMVSAAAIGGAYLGGKSNMIPDDTASYVAAVQAMVSRGVAAGRSGLIWELWNEIDQTSCMAQAVTGLGTLARLTYQAIKAIDPTAIVLSPSIAGGSAAATMQAYLAASDGAGGKAWQWCDGISLHYYVQTITGYDHPTNCVQMHSATRAACVAAGAPEMPFWMTETGVMSTEPLGGLALQRRMLTFAALGYRCFLGYAYDTPAFPVGANEALWNVTANLLRPGAVISSLIPGTSGLQITIDGVDYAF
jgi:hypothetical protein